MSSKRFGSLTLTHDLSVGDDAVFSGKMTTSSVTSTVLSKSSNYNVTALDSGKVLIANASAGLTLNLPAVADASGFSLKVILGASPATGNVVVKSLAANMHGINSSPDAVATASSAGTAQTNFNFVSTKAKIGDSVMIYSDGSKFFCYGTSTTNDACTFT